MITLESKSVNVNLIFSNECYMSMTTKTGCSPVQRKSKVLLVDTLDFKAN